MFRTAHPLVIVYRATGQSREKPGVGHRQFPELLARIPPHP